MGCARRRRAQVELPPSMTRIFERWLRRGRPQLLTRPPRLPDDNESSPTISFPLRVYAGPRPAVELQALGVGQLIEKNALPTAARGQGAYHSSVVGVRPPPLVRQERPPAMASDLGGVGRRAVRP